MKKKKNRGRSESFIGILFMLLLLVGMVLNLVMPDKEWSDREGRQLASAPGLTMNGAVTGSFAQEWETYMSDQAAGRNVWLKVRTVLDRLGGSRLENGVYIGRDGQLLEEIEVPDDKQLSENLDAIVSFTEDYQDVTTTVLLVPDAANILSGSLPAFATVEDQRQLFGLVERELGDSVNWVDAASVLNEHASEKIYYKTDQHWTSLGAFYVFREAAGELGIEGEVSDDFVSYTVSDSFNGDLAARSGSNTSEREKIDIYVPSEGDDDVVVNYVDEGRKTTSLYDSSRLEGSGKYGVFLGGSTSVADIKTVSTSGRRLLVVKDSFADCFIPFLTPYYREIVVVDPEHYSGTMADIMETYRITDTLILYSGNSFFTDNNISGVFAGE